MAIERIERPAGLIGFFSKRIKSIVSPDSTEMLLDSLPGGDELFAGETFLVTVREDGIDLSKTLTSVVLDEIVTTDPTQPERKKSGTLISGYLPKSAGEPAKFVVYKNRSK